MEGRSVFVWEPNSEACCLGGRLALGLGFSAALNVMEGGAIKGADGISELILH